MYCGYTLFGLAAATEIDQLYGRGLIVSILIGFVVKAQ